MTRNIYNVKYNLDNSRVYDETVLLTAKNSASNYTHRFTTLDVKATFDVGLWLIFEGKIELSGEVQSSVEWGETKTSTTILEVVHKVVVPPMPKATVNLIATNGNCDVPFTFMQRDTLYNRTIVTAEVQDGTYTGSNYYSFDLISDQGREADHLILGSAQLSKLHRTQAGNY